MSEDDFLALESDIFRPFHEAGKVGFGSNVLPCGSAPNLLRRVPGTDVPIPKLRGRDSNRGFLVDLEPALEPGAGAGFLPDPGLDLGG